MTPPAALAVNASEVDRQPVARPLQGELAFIPRDLAMAGNRVFAALDGLPAPNLGGRLRVRRDADTPRGPWLNFCAAGGRFAMVPKVLSGLPALWPQDTISAVMADALAQCSQLEPLLLMIENAIGATFEPEGLGEAPALRLRIDVLHADGRLLQQAAIAFDPAAIDGFRPAPRWGRLADATPLGARVDLPGPRAPRDHVGLLAPGDILLTPLTADGLWPALLRLDQTPGSFSGRYDFVRRRLYVDGPAMPPYPGLELPMPPSSSGEPSTAGAPAGPGAALTELTTQLQVVLPQVTIPLRQLAELGPGCVLDLSVRDELHVDVLANGRQIASGQLVGLGPGYGVLVDKVTAP